MEFVMLITICLLLAIEGALMMFCEYWRENNPWKWFFIKTFTTLFIVFYILHGRETLVWFDLIFVAILAVCFGIDFACTYIDSKRKDSYGA